MLPHASSDADALRIWSCVTCRRRKVKCDRRDPCANCTRAQIDCHFPITGRLPRHRRDGPLDRKSPAERQSELLHRLRRLEAVVTELGAQVEDGAAGQGATGLLATPASTLGDTPDGVAEGGNARSTSGQADTDELTEDFGALVIDRDGSMHIGKGFWTVFCAEVENIFQAVQDIGDEAGQPTSQPPRPGEHSLPSQLAHTLIFGNSFANHTADLHPLPSQISPLWRIFVERVDPFIKVVHVSTMEKVIRTINGDFASAGPEMEALLFAISFAAVASLEEAEAAAEFGTYRSDLVTRFRLGTEKALSHTNLLATTDMTVITAFVIYISVLQCLENTDAAIVWPLTGLLIRISMAANLHIDAAKRPASPSLSVLDVEIHRRLWWQICFIDSRARRPGLSQLSISEGSFDTNIPSNVDDNECTPDIAPEALQAARQRCTDMTVCLIRCEFWYLFRVLAPHAAKPPQVHLQIVDEMRSRIQQKYLQYLRAEENPFDGYIKTMTGLFFARVQQVIYRQHLQRATTLTPPAKQNLLNRLLSTSVSIIAAVHKLKSEPEWMKWRWQLQGHTPWYALGMVLTHICSQPWTRDSERAWIAVQNIFDALSDGDKENKLWQPLRTLVAYSQAHRSKNKSGADADNAQPGLFQADDLSFITLDPPGSEVYAEDAAVLPGTGTKLSWAPNESRIEEEPATRHDVALEGGIDLYALDSVPMDWEAWNDIAGDVSLWSFDSI